MPTYAKVFARILDSTIANNWYTRHLFEDLLKLATWDGEVDLTPEAIARRTGWPLSLQDLREHLARLEAEDPDSRTVEEDGRRIILLDASRKWGWRIVNFQLYRDAQDLERVRTLGADRVRKHRQTKCSACGSTKAACDRERKRSDLPGPCCAACGTADTHTGHVTAGNTGKRHRDGDGDRDEESESTAPTATGSAGVPVAEPGEVIQAEVYDEPEEATSSTVEGAVTIRMGKPAEQWDRQAAFLERWASYPRKEKKDRAVRGFLKTVRTLAQLEEYDRACSHYYPHAAGLEDPSIVMQGGTWFGGRWEEWKDGNPVRGARRDLGTTQLAAEPEAAEATALPVPNAWTAIIDQIRAPNEWLRAARLIEHHGQELVVGVPTQRHIDEMREGYGPEIRKFREAAGFFVSMRVVRFVGAE